MKVIFTVVIKLAHMSRMYGGKTAQRHHPTQPAWYIMKMTINTNAEMVSPPGTAHIELHYMLFIKFTWNFNMKSSTHGRLIKDKKPIILVCYCPCYCHALGPDGRYHIAQPHIQDSHRSVLNLTYEHDEWWINWMDGMIERIKSTVQHNLHTPQRVITLSIYHRFSCHSSPVSLSHTVTNNDII